MSAPAFTPGPWRFEANVNEYGHQATFAPILGTVRGAGEKPDGGEHIAVCVSDLPQAEANAHLIAAAPELYEALDNIASSFPNDAPALIEARAALAKARGEQVQP